MIPFQFMFTKYVPSGHKKSVGQFYMKCKYGYEAYSLLSGSKKISKSMKYCTVKV